MMGKLFGNVFKGLYGEDYLKQEGVLNDTETESVNEEVETTDAPTVKPRVSSKYTPSAANATVSVPASPDEKSKVREKLYNLVVKLNRDGYDFFELWDYTLEMDGGATPANIRNAYKFLVKASGGAMTLDVVTDACNYYATNVQAAMDKNIVAQENEKQRLINTMNSEHDTLTKQIEDYKAQIAQLIQDKAQAETELAQIDSKYNPDIQTIDRTVANGKVESAAFVAEMNNFLRAVQSAVPQ